jgi:hypothetical protein
MEREVQRALQDAGDHAGAFLWRRLCRDLDGGLRVTLAARSRVPIRSLEEQLDTPHVVETIAMTDGDDEAAGLGIQDRMLGCHAVLWVTPYSTALGSGERERLAELVQLGAPTARAVVLEGAELLARLSDDPDAEGHDVRQRVRSLLGDEWVLLEVDEVAAWLDARAADASGNAKGRRREVARVLLRDAWARASDAHTRAEGLLAAAESQLTAEHAVIDGARQRGRRIAAHMLAAVRAHTESLLVDLRDFLVQLEARVPAEVGTLDDAEQVRRVLPHWLHHVVESWMTDRLGSWRAAVLTDLAEVHVTEDEVPAPDLLAPALHPAHVHGERDWSGRLAATAAVGGGAALLVFGQLLPGLLAITGGIAWSAMSRRARSSENRRLLIESAQAALRQMGQEADGMLRDQLVQIEADLSRVADAQAKDTAAARAEYRADLHSRRDREAGLVEQAAAARADLLSALRELDPELATELAS